MVEPFLPHAWKAPNRLHQILHAMAELLVLCTEQDNIDNAKMKQSVFLSLEDVEETDVEEMTRLL